MIGFPDAVFFYFVLYFLLWIWTYLSWCTIRTQEHVPFYVLLKPRPGQLHFHHVPALELWQAHSCCWWWIFIGGANQCCRDLVPSSILHQNQQVVLNRPHRSSLCSQVLEPKLCTSRWQCSTKQVTLYTEHFGWNFHIAFVPPQKPEVILIPRCNVNLMEHPLHVTQDGHWTPHCYYYYFDYGCDSWDEFLTVTA